MKKIFTLLSVMLVAIAVNATVTVTGPTNGILTISTDNQGELSRFDFNSLSADQKACTSIKLIGKVNEPDLVKLVQELNVEKLDAAEVTKFNGENGAFFLGYNSDFAEIKTFTFPKYLNPVHVNWFQNSSTIENIIIPDGVGNGEEEVYVIGATLTSLKSVYIGKGVTGIGNNAFGGDTNLETIVFNPGLKKIGKNAFQYCPAKSINLPEGLELIDDNAFQRAEIFSLHLPTTLKTIGANAFQECDNLSVIVIPEHVEFIGPQAFKGTDIHDVYVLGENTKAAQNAFDPKDTYSGIEYRPNGDEETDRSDWVSENGVHPAVLHYPEAAREKYLNGRILNPEAYPDYYIDGVEWPIKGNNFNATMNSNRDYIGWQEFMLTSIITPKESFIVPNILDDTWYTMCFPFDLTLTQLYTAFGDFTEVCEFVKAETTDIEGGKSIEFQFSNWIGKNKKADDIVTYANKPYMIHPNFGLEEGKQLNQRVVIAGINILPEEQQTPWTNYKKGEDGEYIFVGNYTQQAIPQYAYFLGMKNGEVKIFKEMAEADQNRTTGIWKPYTSIIMIDASFDPDTNFWTCGNDGVNKASMGYNAKFIDSAEEESTTGISEIMNSEKSQVAQDNLVRNINGQVVRRGTTSLEGLPKGLYIVNGKKYMVR